jgi:hypothetical protein
MKNLTLVCALLLGMLSNPAFSDQTMTETQFDSIIDGTVAAYQALAASHGGKLVAKKSWKIDQLSAGSTEFFGKWTIAFSGGLARHPLMTSDGFQMVVCHETGHHFGGFPFMYTVLQGNWAAAEGEADYFAAQVCTKKMWANEIDQNETARSLVAEYPKSKCDEVWKTRNEQNICYREAIAIESMYAVKHVIEGGPAPRFDTPDTQQVAETYKDHPSVQCRMDTSFAGALCAAPFNEAFIPGANAEGGKGSQAAEKEAAEQSCTSYSHYEIGLRPRCWFKPTLE